LGILKYPSFSHSVKEGRARRGDPSTGPKDRKTERIARDPQRGLRSLERTDLT
jgi:hypothetical protein